jgi:hypothetical protein
VIPAAPSAATPPAPGDVGPAAANPDDAGPVNPEPVKPDADPVKPAAEPLRLAAEPLNPDPVKPEADPVKPAAEPVKPPAEPVKADDADPVKPDAPDPPAAGPSGAAMKPAGSSCGSAASVSGPPDTEPCVPAGAPFFAGPRVADLAAAGLRIGGWTAARTSARRAERAFRRRHAVIAKISPSSSRKTAPAMAASLIRVPRMLRWIGLLCTAG